MNGIRALNDMLEGTALPRLNTDVIEAMFTRNTLELIGLKFPT